MSDDRPSLMPPEALPGARRNPPPAPLLAALADLVARDRPALVTLAYRFCWNADDADDAVQDALALATERASDLRDAGRLAPWLKAIVVRQAATLARRRRAAADTNATAAAFASAPATASAPPPVAGIELDDEAARVRALMSELPERQHTAVALRHVCGMEYAEIAAIMEITESTARVLVKNARASLIANLRSDEP